MFVPRPTSKSKLFSSDSWFSISQLVSASNPSQHHYCGTSTGGWISSVLIANIPDRSERGQLTVYPETTCLYGTAYAANRGSEKYSSDFGWSATMIRGKYSAILLFREVAALSNLLPRKYTWPWTCVCQNTHTISPFAKIGADSILKKPFEMLIQCLIPLSCPMFNTKAILNYSIRYLVYIKGNNEMCKQINSISQKYRPRVCLVLWKESGRKENYRNRWMNLD
jgi:hypothetical protein